MKKVVLIGASGFVGSAILNEALNRGFHVTAVVRHPEKIRIENENLEVKRADVSSLDEVCKVCKGADAVISAFNPGAKGSNDRGNNFVEIGRTGNQTGRDETGRTGCTSPSCIEEFY